MSTVNYYGATVSKAVSKDIQSTSRKTYGLNFPFGKNTKRGYFAKESGIELIKSNLNQLLSTTPGERVMLPNFGIDLQKYLFEPLDSTTFVEIKQEILYTISKYAPYVKVIGLRVTESEKLNYSGISGIVISLTVQLSDDTDQVLDISVSIGG